MLNTDDFTHAEILKVMTPAERSAAAKKGWETRRRKGMVKRAGRVGNITRAVRTSMREASGSESKAAGSKPAAASPPVKRYAEGQLTDMERLAERALGVKMKRPSQKFVDKFGLRRAPDGYLGTKIWTGRSTSKKGTTIEVEVHWEDRGWQAHASELGGFMNWPTPIANTINSANPGYLSSPEEAEAMLTRMLKDKGFI